MTEIVVGIDDSPGAQDALAFATRIAATSGASLRLVSAFPYSDIPSRGAVPAYRELLRRDARTTLERSAAATEATVAATEAIADASPARALHELSERIGAALVVVGSTRRGPLGRVVPGSTGERLLHGATCPVAVVPRGYADRAGIRTVGVGYDGSDESKAALAAACQLARRLGATLRVIRVFDATRVGTPALMTIPGYVTTAENLEEHARESLDTAVAALPAEVVTESVFAAGNAGRELATLSEQVDVMIVGSRGYGPRAAVLLGGVTHTLLRMAGCPVIVLPRGSQGLEPLFGPTEAAATA